MSYCPRHHGHNNGCGALELQGEFVMNLTLELGVMSNDASLFLTLHEHHHDLWCSKEPVKEGVNAGWVSEK